VATDAVVARELKALREELSIAQRGAAPPAPSPPADAPAMPPVSPQQTAEERELWESLRELASEATGFFEEAEKNIAMHPTQSVVGALLIGILIGSLLGRR